MKFILQTTRKIGFSAFILSVCLFSAQTAFSQHVTWDGSGDGSTWSDASNWDTNVLPTTTDSVTIIAGANVVVTSNTTIMKLKVFGQTGSQGKVTINSGVALGVNSTSANSPATTTNGINAAVMLLGGIIENNGTLSPSGRQQLDAVRFDNPTSGTVSSTYMGSGTLTCDTQNGTGGGGSASTGAAITFSQTSGTATFTLHSSGMYNFNLFITSATGGTKSVFYCPRGTAEINGTGTVTVGGGRRAIRVIPGAANETPNLTIGSGVTMSLSTTLASATIGMILLDPSALTPTSVSVTNKGTLNFSGDAGHSIYMTNSTTGNTTSFTNEGTININGTFADASSTGGIAMAGSNTTQGHVFTNSGAINLNTTMSGTSTKPLFFCSTSPKNTINNSGTIIVGTNGILTLAFRLGDSKSAFTNSGTVTVGAGSISGTTNNTAFSNNTGGILNLNSGANSTFVIFTNAGGTFNIPVNQTVGRLTVNGGTVTIADGATFTTFLLTLTSGNIPLGTGNIVVTGSIAGGSSTSYIITNGTGKLTNQNVTSVGALFPIGQSASSYDPVVIKPASTLSFGARVGLQTTTIPTSSNSLVVNREWDITGTAGTTDLAFSSSALNKDGSSTRPSGAVGVIGHYNTATSTWDADITATYSMNTWGVSGYTGTFSPFIVASPGAVLSVELTTFKATPLSKINVLTWETASEINNKGFDVQRKTTTGAWETLGFVNGTGKASTYTFEDKAPLSISYYRLRQVDFDGKETVSKIVSVSQNTKGLIRISPNPTSDKVNIQLNQNDVSNQTATIVLFDMTGRQVLTQTTTAATFQLDMSHLVKGMYIVTVQSNNAIYQEKIIRQ